MPCVWLKSLCFTVFLHLPNDENSFVERCLFIYLFFHFEPLSLLPLSPSSNSFEPPFFFSFFLSVLEELSNFAFLSLWFFFFFGLWFFVWGIEDLNLYCVVVVVVSIILGAGDRKQEREKKLILSHEEWTVAPSNGRATVHSLRKFARLRSLLQLGFCPFSLYCWFFARKKNLLGVL